MFRTSSLRPLIATFALLTATSVVACGDSVGSGSDFVTDSWSRPTTHGDLEFGARNPAEFTAEARFHAWTFKLSGDADVAVNTELTAQNLDSILYLYKKQADGNWGSYIAKNDDASGFGLGSQVKKKLDAGEYLVKVKAAKSLMTGSFSVGGSCSGDGCPAVSDFCGPDQPTLPARTSYTAVCAEKMRQILVTPVGHTAPPCLATNLEERAVAYYKEYWNDVYSYDDMADGEEPNVSVTHHTDAGTIIQIDLGGDEDGMDFVFDAEGKLMFYFQHNQSPDWAWFCEGEATGADPGDMCANEVAYNSDYRVEDTTQAEGSVKVDDAATLSPHGAAAIKEYASENGLGATDVVNYELTGWSSGYHHGADVKLSSANAPALTYTLTGDEQYGITLTFRTDANGTDFVCKGL